MVGGEGRNYKTKQKKEIITKVIGGDGVIGLYIRQKTANDTSEICTVYCVSAVHQLHVSNAVLTIPPNIRIFLLLFQLLLLLLFTKQGHRV